MMVTILDEGGGLEQLLSTINSKVASKEDRVDAYLTVMERLRQDEMGMFVKEISSRVTEMAKCLSRDIMDGNSEISQNALQVLGFCSHDDVIVGSLSQQECSVILKNLCAVLLKSADKSTCTRALWCLSKQNFHQEVVAEEIHTVLCGLEHALGGQDFQSVTVEHEAINAIVRLLEQVPMHMSKHVVRWCCLVYPLLVHPAMKVRERALIAMEMGFSYMMQHQEAILKTLIPDLKAHIVPEMRKLMASRNEVFILKVWSYFVQLLGKVLHHGSFINLMLPVIEAGFKSSSTEAKMAAFHAWDHLVENFASDPNIIGDPKRIKLVMQVFRVNNAKTEALAAVKLQSWWNFICKLGSKATVHFDQVCVPLLHFCFPGGGEIPRGGVPGTPSSRGGRFPGTLASPGVQSRIGFGSPVTPKLSLQGSGGTSPVFESLQMMGAEVLALLMDRTGQDSSLASVHYHLTPLSVDVIPGPSFFVKHGVVLISAVRDCIVEVGNKIQDSLLHQIWQSLVSHVNMMLDTTSKKDNTDIFVHFLSSFRHIVVSGSLDKDNMLKCFQAVISLQSKVLGSHAYNVGDAIDMQGTPAGFLLGILFTPELVAVFSQDERFMTIAHSLLEAGMSNTTAVLGFCQTVLGLVEKAANEISNPETVWRLWSAVVHPLMDHIQQTNEVNQGDALEHDFSCMYSALTLPVIHLFNTELPQPTMKTLLKSWEDLYRRFARLSALVTNAEANICCEELCHKLLVIIMEDEMTPPCLDAVTHLCQVITDCVDFSSLTSVLNFGAALAVSPSKWPKRKPKPLGNIHSLVKLTGRLTTSLHGLTDSSERQLANHPSLATTGHNLVAILSMLFTHVSTSAMIPDMIGRLAGHMAEFYRHAGKRVGCKLYNAQFMQKLEKLWSDVTGCVQGRYSGPYDSHLLATLAPLLEVTFLNSRRGIKNQTVLFWNATFARAAPLQYPEGLRPVLAKVKEKTSILLPGWGSVEITVLEETPVSQMTQGESLAPLPTMPGMPSPYKVRGSFLNKPESPFKSPVKPQTPEKKESPARVRRKLEVPVQNMRDDEFVVIPPEPKKKMLLTEHQKEILREKSTLPAMYSSLDQSQDTNMFRNLYDTDSQMTSQSQMLPSQPFVPVMADLKRAVTSMVENKSNLKKSETGMSKPACDEGRRKSVRFSQQKDSEERQTAENGVSGDKSDEHMKEVGDTSNQTRPFEAVFTEVKVKEGEGETSKVLDSCDEVVELTQSQQSQSLLSTPTKMSQSPSRSRSTERNSQSPSTPRRSRSKNSKSPAKRKPVTNLKESIDKWIVKSPRKVNTEEHTKTVTLVEETQSPTKFSKKKEAQYLTVPSSESIILETPEKLDEEQNEINSNTEKASQNLFSASCENPISDTPENSCSPQSTPVKFSPLTKEKVVKLMSTPVIKIKKLTQEEIGQFNPSAKCLALSKEKNADSQEISEPVITISPPDVSSSCPQEEPKFQSVQQDEPDQEKKGRRKSGRPVKKTTKLTTNPSDESKVGQRESKKNSGVSSYNVLEPKQEETESENVEFLQASVRKSGRVRKSKSQLDEETKKRKDSEEKFSEVNSLDVSSVDTGGKNTMENNKEDKNSSLSDIFSSENEEMSPKLLKDSKFTDNDSQINKCEQSSAPVTEISEDKCSEPTPGQKNENMMEISQDVEDTQGEEENGSDDDDDEIPLASYLNNDLTSSNLSNAKNSGTNMADNEEEVAPSCGPELVCTLASDAELSENQRGKKRKRGRPKKLISQSQSSKSDVCSGEGENDLPIWPSGQISLISKSSDVENGDDGEGAAERLLQSTLVSQSEDGDSSTPVRNKDMTQDGTVHEECSEASDLIDSVDKMSAEEGKIGAEDIGQSPEDDEEKEKKANKAESLKESEESQNEIGRKGGKGRTVIKARNKKKAKVLERTVKKNAETEGMISAADRPKPSGEETKISEKLNQERNHKTEAEQTPELTKNSGKPPVRESTTKLKKMQTTKKNTQKISKGKKEQSCTTNNTVVTADKGLNVSFDSDDDVPLGLLPELQKSGDAKVADGISNPPLSSCDKEEENEPQQNSCADMFNDDKAVVQTTPPSSRKSRRPGSSQEAELKKLEIDMKSPKRLRSKKSIFRRSPMNRSLGMALSIARKKKSPDQTPSKKRRKVSCGENSEETPKGEQSLPLTDSAEAPLLKEKGPDSELSNHDNLPEPGSPEQQSGSLPNSSSLQETPRSAMKPFSRSSANDLVTQRLVRTDPVKLVSFRHPTLARRKRLLLGRKREELPVAHHKEDKMEALNRSIKKAYQKDSQKNSDTENTSEARSSPPCSKMAASNGSPVSSFQALRVLQVYSPSASPSAGILKKRRLSGDSGGDSPASPPDKQRRVSFAEPIEEAENAKSGSLSPAKPVNRTLDLTKGVQFAPSPLVTTTPSKVTAAQNKFLTTPSRSGVEDQCKTSPSEEGKKFTQLTPSQNSYHSTQESQLNCRDPVYPDLVECTTPVEKLLPQLTSSMWSRGLGQLVRARNIHTVGHLCKLTEVDIQSLPIQSPKVPTVRRVLEQFETEQENRKMRESEQNRKDGEKEMEKFMQMAARENEADDDESHVAPDSPKCSSPAGNKLPALEDVMENLSPKKSSIRDQLESSFEAMLESSGNIMAEITKLSQSCSQGNQELSQSEQPDLNSAEKTQDNEEPSCSQQELDSAKHILETLGTLTTEMTPEMLTRLPSDQIFTAHQHLSHLMVTVVQALKAKCQSSTFT